MSTRFSAAPWPGALKLTSALGTLLALVVGVSAYRTIPAPPGFTHAFGTVVALFLPAVLISSIFFVVTGYAVDEHNLYIRRLVSSTRIPLDGVSRIWFEPQACRGAIRLFGNAGLYAFTGLYRSSTLGRFRLFATDIRHAVVLVLPGRVVVVTPATPHAFVEYLKHRFPHAKIGRDEPAD